MIYPEGLMHKKINLVVAIAIILAVAGIFAWQISAKALFGAGAGIGINVWSAPIKCSVDPCTGCTTCLSTCPVCGSLAGVCAGLFEVNAMFLSGTNVLHKGAGGEALCLGPQQTTPPSGGQFSPGGQCLGIVYGTGPHLIANFGCSAGGGFF